MSFSGFIAFLKSLFESPKPLPPYVPPNQRTNTEDIYLPSKDEQIVAWIISVAQTFVGERETNGNNRSPFLDKMIVQEGGALGDPYCAYGVMHVNRLVKEKYDIKSSLFQTGSSQGLWNTTPSRFKTNRPMPGYIGVFRDRTDADHGHVVITTSELDGDGKTFSTIEFNTNSDGGRDGDGVYSRHRSTDGTKGLELRGFIKWPEMFS